MLVLAFEGWFQCRLPTDPDPTDEPRGASGFTFAVAGEPDLDRIIRFQDPVAPRSHGPEVGVRLTSVSIDGEPRPDHPLAGARVDLLGNPKFEARNYVLRDSSQGPIVPFHLRVSGGGITIEREDILYPENPLAKLYQVPDPFLERRGSLIPLTMDRVRIREATGIVDPLAYRRRRRELLEADLRHTDDPTAVAALKRRIAELSITGPETLQVVTLLLYNDFRFDMRGPTTLIDPERRIGVDLDTRGDWPIAFWMGAWDADALCGFVQGMLSIPGSRAGH